MKNNKSTKSEWFGFAHHGSVRKYESTKDEINVISVIIYCLLLLPTAYSQNVGINTTGAVPDNSALLDIGGAVGGDTKGLLIPRMTTTQRNNIGSPANSLLIFNTTTTCFEYYYSGVWYSMNCTCTLPLATTANAATNLAATSFDANWFVSTGATKYYLDVDDNSDFSSPLVSYNNLDVGNVLTQNVTSLTCATTYYYRVRANNSCGTSANSNTITVTTSACPPSCGSPFTDVRDGKSYNTVLIGTQCWMAENLNYGSYVDVAAGGQAPAGTQKYCQDLSGVNDASCPFGGLYEWNEMMDGSLSCNGTAPPPDANAKCATPVQGICPAGWHIPSHYEWTLLEKNVGSNPGAFPYDVTTTGWLGTDEGGNMKATPVCGTAPCWQSPNTGATNTSGFTGFPGGSSWSGTFVIAGYIGYWWSATENGADVTKAWLRYLENNNVQVRRITYNKGIGQSVRCVED